MIVQVNRVASVGEAVAFRDAGATHIGVALDPDGRFDDGRFVSTEVAEIIRAAIAPARFVGIAPCFYDTGNLAEELPRFERVLAFRPDFVQVYRNHIPDGVVLALRRAGVPVIDDGWHLHADQGAFIDPQDPPSFLRGQVAISGALQPAYYLLDVASDRSEPWEFLKDDAPAWPGECIQVSDISATALEMPLLLSLMGLGAETVAPYMAAFPEARGFFARLGPDDRTGIPSSRPEPLLEVLRARRDAARQQAEAGSGVVAPAAGRGPCKCIVAGCRP